MSRALYLEGEFRPRAAVRGGILMFQATDAIALIHEAHQRRVLVLGIDTFRLTPDAIEPMYEDTLDMTADGRRPSETDWNEAEGFVRTRANGGFHFEVVLADEVGERT